MAAVKTHKKNRLVNLIIFSPSDQPLGFSQPGEWVDSIPDSVVAQVEDSVCIFQVSIFPYQFQVPSGKRTVCDIENGPIEIVDFPINRLWFSIVMFDITRGFLPCPSELPNWLTSLRFRLHLCGSLGFRVKGWRGAATQNAKTFELSTKWDPRLIAFSCIISGWINSGSW